MTASGYQDRWRWVARLFCLVGLTILSAGQTRAELGAFSYQGRISHETNQPTGVFDFVFALYGAEQGDVPLVPGQTNDAVEVTDGAFRVTIDFGNNPFNGADRWLEIAVRTNGAGDYATLSPRQKIAWTPYALYAGNAMVAGVASNLAAGVVLNAADGSGLTNLNFSQLVSKGILPALDARNLTNLITDTRDFSVNLDKLPYFTRALLYSNQVSVIGFGNSIGDSPIQILTRVMNRYSDRPVQGGTFHSVFPAYYNANPIQYEYVPDLWWGRSQVFYQTNGQVAVWGGPGGGGYINATSFEFWYLRSESNGVATIEVSTDLASFTPLLTLDQSGPRGIYVTNVSLPHGNYAVRITATNRIQYLWPGLVNVNARSTRVADASAAGVELRDFVAMGTNSVATLLTNLKPHLIIYTQSRDVSSRSDWPTVKQLFDTYAPNADVVICAPQTSGDPGANAGTNTGGWFQLLADRQMCITNGWTLVDCFTPLSDWSQIVALGLNTDQIHFNSLGKEYLSSIFWQKLRLIERLHLTGCYVSNPQVRVAAPEPAELGVNGGRLWIGNGVLYYTWSTNGVTATTSKVAGP